MTQPILTDRDVKAMFDARAGGTINPELAVRIHAAAATAKQRRAFRLIPGFGGQSPMRTLAFAAVLGASSLALVGVLLVGGSRNDAPVATPPPSGPPTTASPSPSPTPSPTPSATPSATPLPPGTRTPPETLERPRVFGVGWIATAELPLYAAASESATVIGRLPSIGTDLFFLDGPVEAEGFVWWKVQPYASDAPESNTYGIGWVRAGAVNSDEPPILGYVPDCPTSPIDVETSLRVSSYTAIACFGSDDVILEGHMSCSEADVYRVITGADWLRGDRVCQFETAEGSPLISVHGNAVYDLITPGQVVTGRFRVTVHVNDAQSTICQSGGAEGGPTPEHAVLECRKLLVATAVERLD